MRQVVLDTETTGISPELGHRIIEIGCVELMDRRLTNSRFHAYLNPQRNIDEAAFRVHGLSIEFLQDKPLFKDVAAELIEFIRGAELIIHNAAFDLGFLNTELKLAHFPLQIEDLSSICDTLLLAKEKHPGQRISLDALCKRYEIDNSNRKLHGALLDAEILASVYLAMTGGQANLFDDNLEVASASTGIVLPRQEQLASTSPVLAATSEELAKHQEFVRFLVKKSGNNLWG